MINQFNERITYNEQTEKVSWVTRAGMYPLPPQYQEVEYIENCNGCKHGSTAYGGRIILDDFKMSDIEDGDTLNIDFNMSRINVPVSTVWFGCGRFSAASKGQKYNMSAWTYSINKDLDGNTLSENKCAFLVTAPGQLRSRNTCYTSLIEYTPYYIYNFNIHYIHSGTVIKWGGAIREYNTWETPYYRSNDASTAHGGEFDYDSHLCIFDIVMRDFTYPQYYAWAWNYRATSTAPAFGSTYNQIGKRFYSRGKITLNDTMYMYLYACYNKQTHQYGLYDAVNNKFYGEFVETYDNVWVNNPNYYWERINTASGSTVQAKEKTFLNICGPDIQTT